MALYVLVARFFPGPLHPRIFAAFSAAWVVPSLVGPFAAGVVAQVFSWHWVFLGVVGLVIPALAMIAPVLRGLAEREKQERRITLLRPGPPDAWGGRRWPRSPCWA